MRLIASVYAYDVMTNVHVRALVTEYPDNKEDPPSTVIACTTTVPGTGETDPRQWLVDALVALLEDV
jgi:hypothetical protein